MIALSSYSYVQSLDIGRTLHFFAMTLVLINCKYRHKFVENELLKEKCKKKFRINKILMNDICLEIYTGKRDLG